MKQQWGGTVLGLIVGMVIGLGVALAVAVYVTKVPVPFLNKGPSRSVDQDAAEARRNKDWDPNAPLYGKNPARAAVPAAPGASGAPGAAAGTGGDNPVPPAVAGIPTPGGAATPVPANTAPSPDPLGDLARARAGTAGVDPLTYFVQVGAYRTANDAESQRARLSLGGVEARVSEREQSGRTVYRVRVGPFDKRDDAELTKEKLEGLGMEAALVRVQR
ncbi:MAG: SPOR domain-containing protein [Hyphomicrobiales bacterium]|nr:SPOR domain-containing protein [Hyphomicrobiales bacterium]